MPKKLNLNLILLLLLAAPLSQAADSSLSDLTLEEFDSDKKEDTGPRNPFVPGAASDNPDPSLLSLDGIIVGPDARLALISGRIAEKGQSIGDFIVTEIEPGIVMVHSVAGPAKLTISSYLPKTRAADLYEIIFQSADLKDALNMVASAGNFNIILPEDLAGRVSLIFRQTPLKEALAAMLRVNGLDFVEEGDIIRVGKLEEFKEGTYFGTEHIQLKYANAKDMVEALKKHVSEKGAVTHETRTNSVIIKDSQSTIDNIKRMVAAMDKQDTQVQIEAKIVDVTRTFSRSLGIQWGFTKDTGQIQGFGAPGVGDMPGASTPAGINFPAVSPTSGAGLLVGNLFGNVDLNAQITAAEEKGDVHIISQPTIMTISNMPAKIRSGLKIYVKNTSSIAVGGSGGSSSGEESDLEEIDTGIELTVTPQITTADTVKLKIDAEESEADFTRTVDGIPAVLDNTASTTVVVRDGETTVIGGLMKVKKTNTKKGVPFISQVPVIGWFFSGKTKAKTDNELLVFITPRIVKDTAAVKIPSQEAAIISQAEKVVTINPSRKKNKHRYFRRGGS
ncbi:MAG: secretin N-terminal domain-containing protein [Deltaproteobacteria bacterium]|nr:secretin N-terminal domain-containing protein [Deltaproteobacteria bacterium]